MLVAIEALIGTGKTTLTEALAERCGFSPFPEPVESNPFLNLYYEDSARWAYAMQVNLLWERFKLFQEAHYRSLRGETCVMDRSYYGDYAFAIVQHEDGYFTEAEFGSYERMHEALQPQLVYPDLLIWLELPPEEAARRIAIRNRSCEAGISLDYLRHLESAYQRVLSSLAPRCSIVRIDASQNAQAVLAAAQAAIATRREEFAKLSHPCYK